MCGLRTAPHVTSQARRCRVSRVGRSCCFSAWRAQETGSRNEGRSCEAPARMRCAGRDSMCQGGLPSQVTKTGGLRSKLHCGSLLRGYSGSCRFVDDDTLPGSELATELRFCGVSPDCLEVGVRARAVSISPPWGSGETMGAHLPSEVYLGQDTRRPGPERNS